MLDMNILGGKNTFFCLIEPNFVKDVFMLVASQSSETDAEFRLSPLVLCRSC